MYDVSIHGWCGGPKMVSTCILHEHAYLDEMKIVNYATMNVYVIIWCMLVAMWWYVVCLLPCGWDDVCWWCMWVYDVC